MKKIAFLTAFVIAAITNCWAQESEVAIECHWGNISATLTTPEAGGDTAIVIVAGSGPTDRNGNSSMQLTTDCYKMLSEELSAEGFAVLRYDKRAIGRSPIPMTDIPDLTLDDYVDDAMQCVEYLRDMGYKRVFIAGHSEGGLIALIAANRGIAAEGLILLAAPGYPMDEILHTQLSAQLMPIYAELLAKSDDILRRLKAGERVAMEEIPLELISLFNPTVQPFLINCMQYDPQQLAKECTLPMLSITGGNDIQVSVDNGEAIARNATNGKHITFDNMTHVLKDWSSKNQMEQMYNVYTNAKLQLTTGLTSTIAEFINNI
jgi:pimeloyl-ACP methyl ester carboxylesterase